MNAIAAVDANWAIGNKNRLLTSIPADMKFFREKTMGHVVVMGRKTLESFPNGLPLKNRVNIVLTANRSYKVKDAIIVHTKEELLEELKKYGIASEDSFRQAIYVAIDVFRNRQREKEAHANPLRKQYYEKRDDSDKLKLDSVEEDL